MVNKYFSNDDTNISVYVTCKALYENTDEYYWKSAYTSSKNSRFKEIHNPKNNIHNTFDGFDTLLALQSQVDNTDPDQSFSIKNVLLTQNEIENGTGELDIEVLFGDFFSSNNTDKFLIQIFFKDDRELYSLPSNIEEMYIYTYVTPTPS